MSHPITPEQPQPEAAPAAETPPAHYGSWQAPATEQPRPPVDQYDPLTTQHPNNQPMSNQALTNQPLANQHPPYQQLVPQPPYQQQLVAHAGNQPLAHQPIGRQRSTGLAIFLYLITFGIYSLVWTYQVHDEMKRHSNQGVGGGIALLIALFAGFVSPFLVSAEVGQLYRQRGQRPPVSGATGLWCLLGIFILIGPIVWFVKTNGALNAHWRSLGAQ